ncbi:hypothetical protein N7490_006810 [Penicillium lividum]|nr:hypothetical protein N7490_006810 [Penicillium lividum]
MTGDHGSQAPVVMGICLAFAILTFLVLALRLFARIYVLGKMGVDDYLIIGAAVRKKAIPVSAVTNKDEQLLAWAFIGATIAAVKSGLGSHIKYVDPKLLGDYAFSVWMSSMFYLACLGFIKTSVLLFYTRLGDRNLTRMSWIMIGVIICQAGSFVLVAAFQCTPVSKAWTGGDGKCVNINIFYLCNAALNILTDLLTYTLPVGVIFKLQMPQKQKIALVFILCLGLFACVSSIVRITYIPAMLKSSDYTYAISGAMYWSVIETNVGILAASIPSFKAIASRFLPRFIGEYSSGPKYGPWSGTTDARKYGSGFTKVTDPNYMGTMNQDDIAMGTQIGAGDRDNSSEDRIIIPDGKIFTQTEIETTVETSNNFDPAREEAHRSKRGY